MDALRSTWREPLLAWHYRNGRIRQLAKQTLTGPPPETPGAWIEHPAIRELGGQYAAWAQRPPYWTGEVLRPLLAAVLLAAAALAIHLGFAALVPDAGPAVGLGIEGLLLTLSIVAAVRTLQPHGPELITAHSCRNAWERLRDVTDDHVVASTLPMELLMIGVLIGDGLLLGSSIARSLAAFLTPALALSGAIGWGLGSALLIWHFAVLAAHEHRENIGRATARRLDASPHDEDRLRAQRLMERAGSRLGYDLSAVRFIAKRVTLFTVAGTLALASVGLRVLGAGAGEPEPMAAVRLAAAGRVDLMRPHSGSEASSTPDASEGARERTATLIGAVVLAAAVVAGAAAVYWLALKSAYLDEISSPRDQAIVRRFAAADAADAFNRAHLRDVCAALDARLQRLARELETRKNALSPSQARRWPPMRLRAADVLADALRATHNAPTGTPLGG